MSTIQKIVPFLWFDEQAMEAMLKTRKLDIAALKAAFDGAAS